MKTVKNKISVLLSVFNGEKTLERCVESILTQTYKDFELLIINDGSDDATGLICDSFNDDRIKLFKVDKNQGLTKSLNYLASFAEGEFLARQDADDLSLNLRFEKQINLFFEDSELDFVTSRALDKNNNKKIPRFRHKLNPKIAINYFNPFIHGTLMIKNSSFQNIGGYDERFKLAQDYRLFKTAITNNSKYKFINEPLYVLNNQDNLSNNFKKEQAFYANCVKKNLNPNSTSFSDN